MRVSAPVIVAVAAVVAAMSCSTASAIGPFFAIAGGGRPGDDQTSIVYNPATGEIGVDAPASVDLTSVNLNSGGGIFADCVANPLCDAVNLDGDFDIFSDDTVFKATFGSAFGTLSFGEVANQGLSEAFVLNDVTVDGSLASGGDLGNVDLIYVPEPSSCVLLGVGMMGLAGMSRRRGRAR